MSEETPKALRDPAPFEEVICQLDQLKVWVRHLAAKAGAEQRAFAQKGIMCPDIEGELLKLKVQVRSVELLAGNVSAQIEGRIKR